MAVILSEPDLSVTLSTERFAPRVARLALGELGSPSPDLRDAVMLLTSNMVTRACRRDPEGTGRIQLRAWMPRSLVRVEIHALDHLLGELEGRNDPLSTDYDVELLSALSDRWGMEREDGATVVWFEIDRVARI